MKNTKSPIHGESFDGEWLKEGANLVTDDDIRLGDIVYFMHSGEEIHMRLLATDDREAFTGTAYEVKRPEAFDDPDAYFFEPLEAIDPEAEALLDRLLSGVSFFNRDTTLTEDQLQIYRPGLFLEERKTPLECTHKSGGMTGQHRFLIVSCEGRDVSPLHPNAARWGLIMIPGPVLYLKVLDVQTVGDYVQITLLELPEKLVRLFQRPALNDFEKKIVAKVRQDFRRQIALPPDPALQEPGWQMRVSSPVGTASCRAGMVLSFARRTQK